jgi:membrane-associated protease RseP (regulator of RpoE activity)
MRIWPLGRRAAATGSAAAGIPEAVLAMLDELRRQTQDVLAVRQQELRGAGFAFGGDLLLTPAQALSVLEPRFAAYGYTPFLAREQGQVWVRAVPLGGLAERSRPLVNLILFLLTVASTLAAGCFFSNSFPFVTFNPLTEPAHLMDGVPFAATLLAILVTHEFGHYFTARHYGAAVSLPYFIPAPPPLFLFGTLGAIIRMRSPGRDKNALFDIAVAGPLAGLAVALPALWLGLGWSRVGLVPPGETLAFGESLLMRFFVWMAFGSVPEGMDVFVHPVALGAWAGCFVTALNLVPVGQLDGGRLAYAVAGAHHREVAIGAFIALVALAAVAGTVFWLVFAGLVLVLVGLAHVPPLDDLTPLTPERYALGLICLVLLVVLIPPIPLAVSGH